MAAAGTICQSRELATEGEWGGRGGEGEEGEDGEEGAKAATGSYGGRGDTRCLVGTWKAPFPLSSPAICSAPTGRQADTMKLGDW